MHGLYQAKDVVLRRVSYLWGICILRSVKMILECLYLARLGVMKARISVIRIAREHAESSHEIAPPPIFLAVLAVFFLLGCDSGLTDLGTIERSAEREHAITGERRTLKANGLGHLITRDTLILNPTGYTPLAAELRLETTHPVQVELEIVSPYEGEEHLVHRFEEIASSFTLPVLGLYASHRNTLRIRFYDRGNQFMGQEIRRVETPPLIPELPTIEVVVNTSQKNRG